MADETLLHGERWILLGFVRFWAGTRVIYPTTQPPTTQAQTAEATQNRNTHEWPTTVARM